MELTVLLCNDGGRSRANHAAPPSSAVCSRGGWGYFLFDLKWGSAFFLFLFLRRTPLLTSEEMLCFFFFYKAPLFELEFNPRFSFLRCFFFLFSAPLVLEQTEAQGWHTILHSPYLHWLTCFDIVGGAQPSLFSNCCIKGWFWPLNGYQASVQNT